MSGSIKFQQFMDRGGGENIWDELEIFRESLEDEILRSPEDSAQLVNLAYELRQQNFVHIHDAMTTVFGEAAREFYDTPDQIRERLLNG